MHVSCIAELLHNVNRLAGFKLAAGRADRSASVAVILDLALAFVRLGTLLHIYADRKIGIAMLNEMIQLYEFICSSGVYPSMRL